MDAANEREGRPGIAQRLRRFLGGRRDVAEPREAPRIAQPGAFDPHDFEAQSRLDPLPLPDLDELFRDFSPQAAAPRALREAPVVTPGCALCGASTDAVVLYEDLPLVDTPGSRIVRCAHCDFVFLSPRQAELADSWWNARTYLSDCLIPRMKKELQIDAEGRFDPNRNWFLQRSFVAAFDAIPAAMPRSVLDVGCSFGGLIHALELAGYDARGIEPSEHVAAFGRATLGVDIEVGTFEALRDRDPVPCIAMTEVLEHCFDPRAAIRAAHDALLPGGLFFASVPNFESPARKELGRQWPQFVTDHFSHFTGETLGEMLVSEGFADVLVATAEGFLLLTEPLPGARAVAMHEEPSGVRAGPRWLDARRDGKGLYVWAYRS